MTPTEPSKRLNSVRTRARRDGADFKRTGRATYHGDRMEEHLTWADWPDSNEHKTAIRKRCHMTMTAEQEISATLKSYEAALNASDTDAVMKLYSPDAVFMAQALPTCVGADAIRKSYDTIFKRITLAVTFTVIEAIAIDDRWGFARTSSAGKQTINATGEVADEANHELFVFENVGGSWLMARYCFSTQPVES